MRIFIINKHPKDILGGSEIQCDLIATYLAQNGHQVIYLAINGKSRDYGTNYLVEPITINFTTLQRLISKYQPDVVYWRANKRKLLPAVIAVKYLGPKFVFGISHINDVLKWGHKVRFDAETVHGKMIQRYRSLRPALSGRVNHFGFHWVDGVVAQLHQQSGKLPVKKERIIYNSVLPSYHPFLWQKPFVVWAGSIKGAKNPGRFIELAEHLRELPVDFLMVGKIVHGQYAALLEKAQRLPNFHYLGVKTYGELNGILRQSLFLAHTCQPEGFPNVFIQAWSQGKPTVSLCYDPDKLIQTHGLGFCSGGFERFVQDTRALVTDDPLRDSMARRANIFAHKHFDIETNVKQLERFLQEICHPEA